MVCFESGDYKKCCFLLLCGQWSSVHPDPGPFCYCVRQTDPHCHGEVIEEFLSWTRIKESSITLINLDLTLYIYVVLSLSLSLSLSLTCSSGLFMITRSAPLSIQSCLLSAQFFLSVET